MNPRPDPRANHQPWRPTLGQYLSANLILLHPALGSMSAQWLVWDSRNIRFFLGKIAGSVDGNDKDKKNFSGIHSRCHFAWSSHIHMLETWTWPRHHEHFGSVFCPVSSILDLEPGTIKLLSIDAGLSWNNQLLWCRVLSLGLRLRKIAASIDGDNKDKKNFFGIHSRFYFLYIWLGLVYFNQPHPPVNRALVCLALALEYLVGTWILSWHLYTQQLNTRHNPLDLNPGPGVTSTARLQSALYLQFYGYAITHSLAHGLTIILSSKVPSIGPIESTGTWTWGVSV